jgi:rod shape determining protein RodA
VTYAPATLASRSRHLWARADPVLLVTTLLLMAIGALMIYSATKNNLALNGDDPRYWLKRQAVFVILGLVIMVGVIALDYRRLEHVSTVLYVGTLFALLAVLGIGTSSQGAQRWFALGPLQLQPSEFATLVLIIAIATYCARRPDGLDFRDLVRMVMLAALPILLVIKQPDLGTAIVMTVVLMVMLAVAGMPGRYLILLLVGATLVVFVAAEVGLLQHYQIQRLTGFISPNGPGQTVHYNVSQAKNAIADGGIFGKGLFHGTSTNLSYVPEQQTDFIFSAVGEQLGFVGASVLLVLYVVLAWRILRTAQLARDMYGRLICAGVFALLVYSVFQNVGMNMGIMPVAGIPLPFLSYGGSSIIAFCIAIGLVTSVHIRSVR